MEKTITLALNRFTTLPVSLRQAPTNALPCSELLINLGSLYHHYYLDAYGRTPPDPDPAQFEYLRFLLPTKEFRLREGGIGISTVMRRHSSTVLGQAFCRMFLHDHLGIAYFAHLERVLNRGLVPPFSSLRVNRIHAGDAPDYLCAKDAKKVFLSEAKGRYSSVSFSNQEFVNWRKQFDRVEVQGRNGEPRRVKGFIVATRFGTENQPSVKSGLFAEDPESPGEAPLDEDEAHDLGGAIIGLHYSEIALKLGQPILASALFDGFTVPEDIGFPVIVWQLRIGPFHGMRFVGGFFPSITGHLPFRPTDKGFILDSMAPFRLDVGSGTFVGVEESIFRNVTTMARFGTRTAGEMRQLVEEIQPFYSGFSLLRDGSVMGPIEFFVAVESTTL